MQIAFCFPLHLHDKVWKIDSPESGDDSYDHHHPPEDIHIHRIGKGRPLLVIVKPTRWSVMLKGHLKVSPSIVARGVTRHLLNAR